MTSLVHRSQVHPHVLLGIVDLGLELGLGDVLSGAGDDQELFAHCTAGMAMARVLHFRFDFVFVLVFRFFLDLQ